MKVAIQNGNCGKSLKTLVKKSFDFRPQAIIERLQLKEPVFQETACYGHFGREGFSWEEVVGI
ncbi:MAG: methionine adenosyltransferase domain-containing protein [Candidatus Pacebacteria bacterium]|nr:methionine adenosyltransferase domain-containing protein [Candidatus Paceibacterota bacterium]